GIGGYFFYMYQNMLIYQSAIEAQRNLVQTAGLQKNITTSNLTPFNLMNSNQQQQNDAKSDSESIDKKLNEKNETKELVLLSDELEKRRAELEKQRIAITEELERLKLEMEQKRQKGIADKTF
ncbi:MAG TPA: hypothetical protein PK800_01755, partial [Syntrophorhabdaceae bacterium]|nr:hypothetical protein [Syntrophorhabdaceae bacterium]